MQVLQHLCFHSLWYDTKRHQVTDVFWWLHLCYSLYLGFIRADATVVDAMPEVVKLLLAQKTLVCVELQTCVLQCLESTLQSSSILWCIAICKNVMYITTPSCSLRSSNTV